MVLVSDILAVDSDVEKYFSKNKFLEQISKLPHWLYPNKGSLLGQKNNNNEMRPKKKKLHF
jgi:hypothetical protein